MANLQEGHCVIRPTGLVEVGRQKPACLVLQQRIDACDKISVSAITATKVPFDDGVIRWDEGLMRAFTAFDLRLAAYAGHPFIATRR